MQQPDLIQQMKEKAEIVQAVVATVTTFEDACEYAVDLTRSQGGQTVVAPDLTQQETIHLTDRCNAGGLTLLAPPFRPHAENIHTALTHVDWGIAETGSLGRWAGYRVLRMVERKLAWLESEGERLITVVSG